IRAPAHMAARLTEHRGRKAPAIQEENGLFSPAQPGVNRFQQGGRKNGRPGCGARQPAHIENPDHRQVAVVGALGESDQKVFSSLGMVPTFHRGSRASQNDSASFPLRAEDRHVARVIARRFLLLVGALVLFVDDDDTQLVQWREYRAAGANHDPRGASMNSMPLIVALALGKMAVKNRHFALEIRKARLESFDRLGRKGDFRYQDERRATKIYRVPDG